MKFNSHKLIPLLSFTGCLTLSVFSPISHADDALAEKGRVIAQEVENKDIGFHDSQANVEMIMIDHNGSETKREFEFKRLEAAHQGDKSLVKFVFPADIRGTALLTHPQKTDDDEQWLYLPGINRTKRISSRNKSGAFVGSEFSFEDMSDKSIDEFSYQYLKTEPCNVVNESFNEDILCDAVVRVPKDKTSGYSKQIVWTDQQNRRVIRIDFYDRKAALLKTMQASGFVIYNEKYWRPTQVSMSNVQNGRETKLNYLNISLSNGLSEQDLSRRSLRGS